MKPTEIVTRLFELQQRCVDLKDQIGDALKEADSLIQELTCRYEVSRTQGFMCGGKYYKLNHAAIGFGFPGNRDWLETDERIKSLEEIESKENTNE